MSARELQTDFELIAFISDLNGCIATGHNDAVCIPWVNRSSSDSLDAVHTALIADGWKWNRAAKQYERGGWYVWMRSQGELSSPIAQWNRLQADFFPDLDEQISLF
jgi:hypothetical protein